MPAVVASIEPTALPVGPPADTVLHVFGTGFESTSRIRFGVSLERTDYVSAYEVTTIITAGVFPNPGEVPVSVLNADGSESNAVTFQFVVVPAMPPDGTLVANLENLKAYVGARSTTDDVILQQRLDVATEWVYERCYPDHRGHANVQEAILLLASRLYKRRQAPEGTAGWGGEFTVLRIIAGDPDVESLIDRHRDWSKVGIG